jgi:hypothetical protein
LITTASKKVLGIWFRCVKENRVDRVYRGNKVYRGIRVKIARLWALFSWQIV